MGLGRGCFGRGQFGLDADTFEWVSEQLKVGVYKFAVKIFDEAGNQSGASETGEVAVIPAARPAEQLSIYCFDKDTNQLMLSVS